jgi:large subunit ribosomal protein L1
MNKESVTKALVELKKSKRKFVQSYDLIVTLRDVDVKTQAIDSFFVLPHSRGKNVKVCALVGQELSEKAAETCDFVVRDTMFDTFKGDPKKIKQLAKKYDFFIAQANLMAQIATVFGRTLGPRNKMPSPKAGCVVPANADLKVLVARLQKIVHLKAKSMPMIQCIIGNEGMEDDQVVENVTATLSHLGKLLPNEQQNIHTVYLKKTMSSAVKI